MFPNNYPKCLVAVSWSISNKDDVLFGINARYNKFCKNASADNPYFIQNMLKNHVLLTMLKDSQTIPKPVLKLIKYIVDTITIRWSDDEFIINLKKTKENDKYIQKFNEAEYLKIAQQCQISSSNANKFRAHCLEYLRNEYNKIILKNFQNIEKKL